MNPVNTVLIFQVLEEDEEDEEDEPLETEEEPKQISMLLLFDLCIVTSDPCKHHLLYSKAQVVTSTLDIIILWMLMENISCQSYLISRSYKNWIFSLDCGCSFFFLLNIKEVNGESKLVNDTIIKWTNEERLRVWRNELTSF